jgi:uncharacterized membrane protein
MTNGKDVQHNGLSVSASAYNVISVSFDPDPNAYAALTALKELDSQKWLKVEAAAVIERSDDGQILVKDSVGSGEFAGTASGGLLGLMIGIIGGPLGGLVGGTSGLVAGSLIDLDAAEQSESALAQMAASVKPGRSALVAQLTEQSPELVDTAMERLGGTVLRRSTDDVEAEIAAAEKAQREARLQATEELLRGRRARTKDQISAELARLKAKLARRTEAIDRREDRIEQDAEKIEAHLKEAREGAGNH